MRYISARKSEGVRRKGRKERERNGRCTLSIRADMLKNQPERRAVAVRGNATGNSVNRSTRMFYPNENNGRDRYEAPGNWRRRLMKTKREAEADGPGAGRWDGGR